jgi:hypothetical protein
VQVKQRQPISCEHFPRRSARANHARIGRRAKRDETRTMVDVTPDSSTHADTAAEAYGGVRPIMSTLEVVVIFILIVLVGTIVQVVQERRDQRKLAQELRGQPEPRIQSANAERRMIYSRRQADRQP